VGVKLIFFLFYCRNKTFTIILIIIICFIGKVILLFFYATNTLSKFYFALFQDQNSKRKAFFKKQIMRSVIMEVIPENFEKGPSLIFFYSTQLLIKLHFVKTVNLITF
jgi:rRNA maturation protein Rpf1